MDGGLGRMTKVKDFLMDRHYLKICSYVALTSITVYLMYLFITHFPTILGWLMAGVGSLSAAFAPALIGLILAYLLSPVVHLVDQRLVSRFIPTRSGSTAKVLKRTGQRRTISILLTYLVIAMILVLIIYAFAALVGGQLMSQSIYSLLESITAYFEQYENIFRDLGYQVTDSGMQDQLQPLINSVLKWISDHFSTSAIISFITSLGGGVLNFLLGLVVSIYLLKDKDFFLSLWRKFLHTALSKESSIKLNLLLTDINSVIGKFLRGQLLDGLIVAVIASISLSLVGLDFAVFIGFFAGIANIIPYFGPILGMIPAVIVGLLTGGISQAVFAVIVLLVIQQIDSAIISPRVVGSSVGLHPVMVLISVTVGGYYWGIIGMLLAVPTAGIIRVLVMKQIEQAREEKEGPV